MANDSREHAVDNLATIIELGERELRATNRHQRAVERLTRAVARPLTLYLMLAVCALWVADNLLASAPFDPSPFPDLQGLVAIYAATVATCVLIAQSRQQADAERRANLELHVNLVAEQKATKIISLLEELRRDLPNVRDRTDLVADELQHGIDARAIHDALDPSTDEDH